MRIHTCLRRYRQDTPGVLSWEDIVAEELEKLCDRRIKLTPAQWLTLQLLIKEVAKDQGPDLRIRAGYVAKAMNIHLWGPKVIRRR